MARTRDHRLGRFALGAAIGMLDRRVDDQSATVGVLRTVVI